MMVEMNNAVVVVMLACLSLAQGVGARWNS